MKLKIFALVLGLALIAAACNKQPDNTNTNNSTNNDTTPANSDNAANQTPPVTVQLTEQNSSKENGTATLTSIGNNQTQVKIVVSNGTTTPQPAHIHVGACPTPGAVKYPLSNVVSGNSITVIDTSLDALLGTLPLAINIHKSATESSTYVACGDIKTSSTSATPTPKTVTIAMTSSGFSPASVTINKGDTVVFVNQDTKAHWPASAPHPTHTVYPAFDSKLGILAGASWSFKFDQVGVWKFHDHLNPTLFGSVTVQ